MGTRALHSQSRRVLVALAPALLLTALAVAGLAGPATAAWGAAPPLLCPAATALLSAPVAFPICRAAHEQDLPVVSGDIVVWTDNRNDPDSADIRGKDLGTDKELTIAATSDFETSPDISGNVVVYVRVQNNKGHIWGKDLSKGGAFPIWTAKGTHSDPKISGNRVVWWDPLKSRGDIRARNLKTKVNYSVAVGPLTTYAPAISGNLVVWVQESKSGRTSIMGKRLGHGGSFTIRRAKAGQMVADPDVSGKVVVWDESVADSGSGHWVVKGKRLPDGKPFLIHVGAADPGQPAIDGSLVVWEDYRNGLQEDLYGKDIDTKVEFPVCADPSLQEWPAISGKLVVWDDNRTDVSDIWGCRLP